MTDIKTSVLFVSGKAAIVTLDYVIDLSDGLNGRTQNHDLLNEFRLSYYPHRLTVFRDMLVEAFHHSAKHTIYGDFKPLDQIKDPGFYIHVLQKAEK